MLAFGVSTQALLYPNQVFNNKLLQNVFLPAYFIIGGEYYTRDKIMAGINAGVNGKIKIYLIENYLVICYFFKVRVVQVPQIT